MADLIVRSLGQQPYMEAWEAMKTFTANRDETTVDELWCLEHPRVFTGARRARQSIFCCRAISR